MSLSKTKKLNPKYDLFVELGPNNEILNKNRLDPRFRNKINKTFEPNIKFDYERPSISEQLRKLEVKPMSEETKKILKAKNKVKAQEKRIRKATIATYSDDIKDNPIRKGKIPIHEDKNHQTKLYEKYLHLVKGSFRPDPHNKNGTVVDIKCKCGNLREVHLGDVWQVKRCLSCR